jgi:hypothetical protein
VEEITMTGLRTILFKLWRRRLSVGSAIALLIILILYTLPVLQRPPRTALQRDLFQGIQYDRTIQTEPRPLVIHTLTIDLTAPGLRLVVSPGDPDHPGQTRAATTTEFLKQSRAQIAVNGSYFYPFIENTPWDYFPHGGDRVYVLGETIADGVAYAKPRTDWHPVCFSTEQRMQISPDTTCPPDTAFALAGLPRILIDGTLPDRSANRKPYARTLAATNASGTMLWLIIVDGKQPFYSEGLTLTEAGQFAQALGATDAIALDGGGSTTLAYATPDGSQLLNAPVHAKIPMNERTIANHIGIYAQPLPASREE